MERTVGLVQALAIEFTRAVVRALEDSAGRSSVVGPAKASTLQNTIRSGEGEMEQRGLPLLQD